MTSYFTTTVIVLNACAGITKDMANAVIQEYIEQNEAYINAVILRNTTFTWSASKAGHKLLTKLATYMTVMDIVMANLSNNTQDQIRTAYDGANDQFTKCYKELEKAAVRDFIQEQ